MGTKKPTVTQEKEAYVQTKLDGFNDCFHILYSMLCDGIDDKNTPESVRAFLHGFTDCMYRDQGKICKVYVEKVIKELLQKVN